MEVYFKSKNKQPISNLFSSCFIPRDRCLWENVSRCEGVDSSNIDSQQRRRSTNPRTSLMGALGQHDAPKTQDLTLLFFVFDSSTLATHEFPRVSGKIFVFFSTHKKDQENGHYFFSHYSDACSEHHFFL